jgi:hypothetical protein
VHCIEQGLAAKRNVEIKLYLKFYTDIILVFDNLAEFQENPSLIAILSECVLLKALLRFCSHGVIYVVTHCVSVDRDRKT